MAFNIVWDVNIIEDGLSEATVRGWLNAAGIPPCFVFTFGSPFSSAWMIKNWYNGAMPFPTTPWTILISSAHDSRFNWANVLGLGMTGGQLGQVSVAHYGDESPDEMGARIWHEVMHCYDVPSDDMQTREKNGFIEYLRTTGSHHYAGFVQDSMGYENGVNHTGLLIAFDNYLMGKYMQCDCYGVGCSVNPPYNPIDNPIDDPIVTPGVDSSDTKKKLMWMAIGVGVFVLLFG